MEQLIPIALIVVIIGLAVLYIYKSKKSGKRCIGCPDSGSCGGKNCGGGCGCCGGDLEEK